MKSFCIVGTDTDAGKSIVTAGIANIFKEKSLNFIVQKWVSTGDKDGFSEDLRFIYNSFIVKKNKSIKSIYKNKDIFIKENKRVLNPYSFKFPASPHFAASLENKSISIQKIMKSFKILNNKYEYVIVEGVGGLLVPITKNILLIDIIKKLKLPVILVALNKLGAINHTLLSIKILNNYNINIIGLIFNNYVMNRNNKIILKDNIKIIEKSGKVKSLGEIPYLKKKDDFFIYFEAIVEKILKKIK